MRRLLPLLLLLCACRTRDVHGSETKSLDGHTWLIVDKDDDGGCNICVDNKPWDTARGLAGRIEAGEHQIGCCATPGAQVRIRAGTTYRFSGWAP